MDEEMFNDLVESVEEGGDIISAVASNEIITRLETVELQLVNALSMAIQNESAILRNTKVINELCEIIRVRLDKKRQRK